MSKAETTFILPVAIEDANTAVAAAAMADGWRIRDARPEHFFLSQQISLLDRMYRYPSNCAVFLHRGADHETRVVLQGRITGFGPLQKHRVTGAVAKLRTAIEEAAKRLDQAPS
jgi:hypothetical protein